MLRGKSIPQCAHIRKEGKSQINDLRSPLKNLEKEEQNKPKASKTNEIKIRSVISYTESKKNNSEKPMKQRNGSLKRSMKLPDFRKTDKERQRMQITNIRNETGNITTDPEDVKMIIREYYEQHCARKFDNLEGMDHKTTHHHNSPNMK